MGPIEDLEIRRRSLAMLPSGSASGLSREEAVSLIAELQAAQHRVVDLEHELEGAAPRRDSTE